MASEILFDQQLIDIMKTDRSFVGEPQDMRTLSKSIFVVSASKKGAIDEEEDPVKRYEAAISDRSDRERLLQYDNDPMA